MKLDHGRENEATVRDLFGNNVNIGVREDGAVLIALRADGHNGDNCNDELQQDAVIAFTAEQTKALAKELLRLQP